MATMEQIACWSKGTPTGGGWVQFCVGVGYANEHGGALPEKLDQLNSWGTATGRRKGDGSWRCLYKYDNGDTSHDDGNLGYSQFANVNGSTIEQRGIRPEIMQPWYDSSGHDPCGQAVGGTSKQSNQTTGNCVPPAAGSFVRAANTRNIYQWDGSAKHLIPDEATLAAKGGSIASVQDITPDCLAILPNGADLTSTNPTAGLIAGFGIPPGLASTLAGPVGIGIAALAFVLLSGKR